MTRKTRRANRQPSGDKGGAPSEERAGRAVGDLSAPVPFADRMQQQGMAPPAALEESLVRALVTGTAGGMAAAAPRDAAPQPAAADEVLQAAEQLLDRILAGQCESRESALDLLTVDALITRAIQIAARDPESLATFPQRAMQRLSAR